MIDREEGRPARERDEVITKEDAAGTEAADTSPPRGLSTADLAGRSQDANRDVMTDAAERAENAERTSAPAAAVKAEDGAAPLFDSRDAERYRARWMEVQTGFVDDPRHAVEQADGLVAEVMKRLAEVFADERGGLEQQWSRGDDVDTESLRVALRRYRSFFDRLLSI